MCAKYSRRELAKLLPAVDLGSSIAEQDTLLQSARVDTSAYTDLFHDRVDLIPGTKGSGKSALYRIFVEFLAEDLLEQRKVVIAHGVRTQSDVAFQHFQDDFDQFSEDDFVVFWCVYLVSLAHEHFVNDSRYKELLEPCEREIQGFKATCYNAQIPELGGKKSLRDVIRWAISAASALRPGVRYDPTDGSFTATLFADKPLVEFPQSGEPKLANLPRNVGKVKDDLEAILVRAGCSLWLMVDRLDEIFPRRSDLETRALRGLLRTLRLFESPTIRVKVFLRDDILAQITGGGEGFTALTHVTARQADSLRWLEEQILTMVTKRIFVSDRFANYLKVDRERLNGSSAYRQECFYRIFPPTVHKGPRQSATLRWIYTHVADGNGAVTPRDVIDLLMRAKQHQQDDFRQNPEGEVEFVIGAQAIAYGLEQLSQRKCETYLQAEFPHFSESIRKFVGGKTDYSERALRELLGSGAKDTIDDLVSIGVLKEIQREGRRTFQIPFLYRAGLRVTRGRAVERVA